MKYGMDGMDSCAQCAVRINRSNSDLLEIFASRALGFLKRAILRELTPVFALVFFALSSLFVIDDASATTYTTTDLGTLGGSNSYAFGINDAGQVVGYSHIAGSTASHAFLYQNGAMIDLGTLGGRHSYANGINIAGQVVGYSETAVNAVYHAFLYQNGAMIDLGTLGGSNSYAYDINMAGQVVGNSQIAVNAPYHAFLYQNGAMIDLGTLGGGGSYALGINMAGQVVGQSYIAGNAALHAFLYQNGAMIDLGTLGGSNTYAYGINNAGQVVGKSQIAGNAAYHAFLYQNGAMIDLGTLGGSDSIAIGINDAGQIVGSGNTAILWSPSTSTNPKNLGQPDFCPTGNPINQATGNKYQTESDYLGSGSFPLTWQRTYNGDTQVKAAALGANWRGTYDRSISAQTTTATVYRPDGKSYKYQLSGGVWIGDADGEDRLQQIAGGWTLTTADNAVETYDSTGKLLSMANRVGLKQTLTYSDGTTGSNGGYVLDASGNPTGAALPAGRLIRVTDYAGRVLGFGYDASGHIVKVSDPIGASYLYGYNTNNDLVSVSYPDAKVRSYLYNESAYTSGANLPHVLTGITDENNARFATWNYDSTGRAISSEHAGGVDKYAVSFTVDANGKPVSSTVTDPLGTQRTHNFTTILGVVKSTGQSQPGGAGCGPASSATTYDANGNVASRADFNGNKTCYAYDLARNLETARVEGLAAGLACPATLASYVPTANTAQRKILTDWHPSFRLPVKITEAGRETTHVYDTRGTLTSRSIKDTATAKTRTWTTTPTYHTTVPGVLVKTVDNGPRLDVSDLTTTDYYAPDANCIGGHLGCRGQIRQITNALGHVTTYNEYDAHGRVTKLTDPNALVTTFTYSPRGWLTRRTVGTELTQFDYDAVGQLIKLTRPDASYVNFEYDPAHRLTAIVLPDGGRLTYTLDAMGNRTAENITDAAGTVYYTHRRSFDALGRLWQDIGALNQTLTYEYDATGNLKQIDGARTDLSDVTRHSYDTLDRLTQTLNADDGIEKRTPNALDQTTRVTDPANQTTIHTVNALDDVTQTVSADTGTTMRTYDEAGNLKTEKDARNVTVTYTYDALNRLTQKQSSQAATPVYTYAYDDCRKGSLCAIQLNGGFHLYFNYDPQGRRTYQLGAIPGVTWLYSQYYYDAYGRLSKTVYPTGRSVTQSYDAQGRINQITTQPQSGTPVTVLARNFVYSYPFAGPKSFSYGNGTGFYHSRNQDYQPDYFFDGPRYKLLSHDPGGNVAGIRDINNTTLTYGYDATGRLVSAIDSATGSFGTLGFSYDKNGNRLSETRNASVLPYTYSPAGSNWLYQKGSDYRIKNEVGNTAYGTSTGFLSYDGYNRLITNNAIAETTTYTYNALGERIKKINQNGLSTVFHYGNNGELLFERDQAGNTKAYVWLDGRPLARIDNDATIYYYHVDHLGTPQAMTNQSGTTVWKADYEPFGKAAVKVSTIENNLRFPGQYFDRETGLHYNYFRDYDSGTGRYIEFDPIGLEGGLNGYAYVGGDPISLTDPMGLAPPMRNYSGGNSAQNRYARRHPMLPPNIPNLPINDNASEAAGYFNDEGKYICLRWSCKSKPGNGECGAEYDPRRNIRRANDYLPAATDPNNPPSGCTCDEPRFRPIGRPGTVGPEDYIDAVLRGYFRFGSSRK